MMTEAVIYLHGAPLAPAMYARQHNALMHKADIALPIVMIPKHDSWL